ncbi:hypothetical protein JCM5353_000999, partial [Sporobolomyces roseus]
SLSDLEYLNHSLSSSASSRPTPTAVNDVESSGELRRSDSTHAHQTEPSETHSTPTPSLASLLAVLQSTTSSTNEVLESTDDGAELDEKDLERMLEKLNEAEGAADDLEGRLDGLIGNLDKMLGLLGVSLDEEEEEEEETPTRVDGEGIEGNGEETKEKEREGR